MLVCRACGRAEDSSVTDLLNYMKFGWPKCCGEVMTLFVETERPGDDGTPLEKRALPPAQDPPPA